MKRISIQSRLDHMPQQANSTPESTCDLDPVLSDQLRVVLEAVDSMALPPLGDAHIEETQDWPDEDLSTLAADIKARFATQGGSRANSTLPTPPPVAWRSGYQDDLTAAGTPEPMLTTEHKNDLQEIQAHPVHGNRFGVPTKLAPAPRSFPAVCGPWTDLPSIFFPVWEPLGATAKSGSSSTPLPTSFQNVPQGMPQQAQWPGQQMQPAWWTGRPQNHDPMTIQSSNTNIQPHQQATGNLWGTYPKQQASGVPAQQSQMMYPDPAGGYPMVGHTNGNFSRWRSSSSCHRGTSAVPYPAANVGCTQGMSHLPTSDTSIAKSSDSIS